MKDAGSAAAQPLPSHSARTRSRCQAEERTRRRQRRPADAVQQARPGSAAPHRRDRPARDRHHRLSSGLRDPATADSGRHPDRDPEEGWLPPLVAPAPRPAVTVRRRPSVEPADHRVARRGRPRCRRQTGAAASSAEAVIGAASSASQRRAAAASAAAPAGAGERRRRTVRRQRAQPPPEGNAEPAAKASGRAPCSRDGRSRLPRRSAIIVQVGAFADAEAARETRQKVEKLGLKTYTQVAQTPSGGSRIRVRVGPFASRDEADAGAGQGQGGGLDAVVLTLVTAVQWLPLGWVDVVMLASSSSRRWSAAARITFELLSLAGWFVA